MIFKTILSKESGFQPSFAYDLPDGKTIDLADEKTMLPERLFNPVLYY